MPEPARVRIDIFDVTGRRVTRLLDDTRTAGQHRVTYDTSDLPGLASGVYLYRIEADKFQQVRKMTLIK